MLITKPYAPGAVIVTEGTFADEMYIIQKGECKLIKQSRLRGQRLMLDIGVLGASDFFGEWGMQDAEPKPRACSVVAVGNVELLVLTRYDFEEHVSPLGCPAPRRGGSTSSRSAKSGATRSIIAL